MKSIEELEQERKARIAAWEKENQKEEEEDVVELIPPPKTLEQLEQERKARMLAWEKEQSNDNESEQSPPRKSVSKSSTTVEHVAVIVETPKSKPTTSSVTNNIEVCQMICVVQLIDLLFVKVCFFVSECTFSHVILNWKSKLKSYFCLFISFKIDSINKIQFFN